MTMMTIITTTKAIKWFEMLNSRVVNDPGVLARLGNIHVKHFDPKPKTQLPLKSTTISSSSTTGNMKGNFKPKRGLGLKFQSHHGDMMTAPHNEGESIGYGYGHHNDSDSDNNNNNPHTIDEAKALHYYQEAHRVYPVSMNVISWLGAFHVRNEGNQL